MSNKLKLLEDFDNLARSVYEAQRALGSPYASQNPLFDRVRHCLVGVYGELAPFQIGDEVELIDAPEINQKDTPGWMGAKHILVNGRKGIIRDVTYDDRGYTVMFEPNNETWIDLNGKEQPVTRPGHYCLGAKRIKKVSVKEAWTQCTSVNNDCLGGCATRAEHERYNKPGDVSKDTGFGQELRKLINRHSLEGGSNTHDFLLASFLAKCLDAYSETVTERDRLKGTK